MKASTRKQSRRMNSLVRRDSASDATDHEYLNDHVVGQNLQQAFAGSSFRFSVVSFNFKKQFEELNRGLVL